jgi:hypothetical protein
MLGFVFTGRTPQGVYIKVVSSSDIVYNYTVVQILFTIISLFRYCAAIIQ